MIVNLEGCEENFAKSLQFLENELKTLRIGRASPALVEDLMVDYYGTKTPLKQLASINIPDSRTIAIQPWDKNSSKEIVRAIQLSDLGLNPIDKGGLIHLNLPVPTEERRKELVKIMGRKVEEARISLRTTREEVSRHLKNEEKEKKISENELELKMKELQKKFDDYHEKIQEIKKKKEEEIMTI